MFSAALRRNESRDVSLFVVHLHQRHVCEIYITAFDIDGVGFCSIVCLPKLRFETTPKAFLFYDKLPESWICSKLLMGYPTDLIPLWTSIISHFKFLFLLVLEGQSFVSSVKPNLTSLEWFVVTWYFRLYAVWKDLDLFLSSTQISHRRNSDFIGFL